MKKLLTTTLVLFLLSIAVSAQKYESENYSLGWEYFKQEDYKNSILYFNNHLEEYPDDNRAFWIRAYVYNLQKEYSNALKDINNSIKFTSKKDEFLYMCYAIRYEIYINMELYDKAELDLKKALTLNSKNEDLWLEIINFYLNRNNYDEVEICAKELLALDISSPYAYTALGEVYRNKTDYQTAIENYDKAIKYSPNYIMPYSKKAHILLLQKKYKEALELVITGIEIDNSEEELYNILLNLVEDAPNDVIRKMNQLIREQKDFYYWYQVRATTYQNIKEFEKALADYLKAAEILEYYDAGQYERASLVCQLMGDYYAALEYINKAIQIAIEKDIIEENPNMYLEKALLESKLFNHSNAIEGCNNAIEIYPSYAYAYTLRGLIYRRQNQMEKALADFNEAIEIDEEDITAYLYRGRVLEALGKMQEAQKDYEMIVKLDTAIYGGNYKIFALFHLGKSQEAIAFLNEILENKTESGTYNAACLYALMNDKTNALKYLELALKTGEKQDFYHIEWDDDLNNIRETVEFKALIAQYDNRHKFNKEPATNFDFVEKTTIVKMKKSSGIFEIPCEINGLKLQMLFDSGASNVTISSTESNFMLKNNYLKSKDILGTTNFLDASGNINEGTVINLTEVKLGDFTLKNVKATVVDNQNAPLLFGQTVLKRFASISIDNEKQELKIIYKEKK